MRVVPLQLRGTVASRSEATGMLAQPGDAVLVLRGRPRILLLMCPSGCGEEVAINLDERAGKAWRLYQRRDSITLYPSVWRDTGCGSHFIVWKNRIYLFDAIEAEDDEAESLWSREVGIERELVLAAMPVNSPMSYVDIADTLDALPWEVLVVCRRLVREGAAREGKDKERGCFLRTH